MLSTDPSLFLFRRLFQQRETTDRTISKNGFLRSKQLPTCVSSKNYHTTKPHPSKFIAESTNNILKSNLSSFFFFLANETSGTTATGKVHGRTVHSTIATVFEGHVLGKDATDLLSHVVPGLLPVEEADATKGAADGEEGNEEGVGRDGSTASSATSSGALAAGLDALDLVGALAALLADLGLGAVEVAGADGGEDHLGRQGPAQGDGVDEGGGEDDDAAAGLGGHLEVEEGVGGVLLEAAGVQHAALDALLVDVGVLHGVGDAVVVGEVVGGVAPVEEFGDVVPPLLADAVGLAVVLPDADAAETLPHDVGAGDAVVEVIVGVGGAVAAVVGAQVEAHVLPVGSLAVGLDAVVDVHVGGEVGPVAEGHGDVLESLLEVPADEVRGGRPEVVLDPVVGAGEGPGHFDLDHVVGPELGLDGVGVLLEHEEGGDGDVLAGPVVGHDGLGRLANVLPVGRNAVGVAAQAGVVGDDDAGRPGPLGVADLLHEGAVAAVDHEDVRAGPGLHLAVLVLGADGIALPRVDGRVA